MNDPIDLLQIKIERARGQLPEETRDAIAAVDWQAVVLGMREKKGYNFEQLQDLEIETELLLCGLLSSVDYPKELQKRMGISKAQVDELVNELNDLVFKKIREELIKNTERKKIFEKKEKTPIAETPTNIPPIELRSSEMDILKKAGIEVVEKGETLPTPEKLELAPPEEIKKVLPILAQKLSGYVQNTVVETEHSLENLTKQGGAETSTPPISPAPKTLSYPPNADPYRLPPE